MPLGSDYPFGYRKVSRQQLIDLGIIDDSDVVLVGASGETIKQRISGSAGVHPGLNDALAVIFSETGITIGAAKFVTVHVAFDLNKLEAGKNLRVTLQWRKNGTDGYDEIISKRYLSPLGVDERHMDTYAAYFISTDATSTYEVRFRASIDSAIGVASCTTLYHIAEYT